MNKELHILHLEDKSSDAELAMRELRREQIPFTTKRVWTEADFLAELRQPALDMILADYSLPGYNGLSALGLAQQERPEVPFILVSGSLGEELAIDALQHGATDYVLKQRLGRLGPSVRRALREAEEHRGREQAEAALRKREADLQLAQQIGHIGSWEVVLNSNTLQWSDETYRIFGLDPNTFVPTSEAFFALVHPDDLPRVQQAAAEATRTGAEYQVEHRIRRSDGTERVVVEQARLLYDAQGLATRMMGTVQDITERKQAEATLQLRDSALQAAANAILITDAQGTILWTNPAFAVLTGYTWEEVMGQNPRLLKSNRQDQTFYQNLWAAILAGQAWQGEMINRHKQGHLYTEESTITPVRGADGAISHFICVMQDITERKRAEEAIHAQARLLDLAQDAILVRDMAGSIRYWNKSCERVAGWTAAEALGQSVDELLRLDPALVGSALRALREKGQWEGELNVTAKDGRAVIVLSRCSLVRDEQGQPQSILTINTDITQKKELEAQFLRAQRLESIGQLAGGIAHDLNNILAPIMMIVPLLRDELTTSGASGLLDTVATSAQRGADIINQILSFSRGLTAEKAPVQTRHLLKEVAKIVEETFPRSIQLQTRLPQHLWLVDGDATQLHQVLMNLVINARDAMSNGGVLTLGAENLVVDEALAARCADATPGPHIVWRIADTGTGMTAEVLARMFDSFFTTKPPGQGTGLGLSTTLGIVRGHGGFLQVESRLGEGTTFRVYLPARQELEKPAPPPAVALPDGQGDLVLVVDDEESVRQVLQRTLECRGFKVVTAGDGVEAIAILQRRHREIELVLVDLMMPGLDGIAVIREVRRLAPALPIIVASGLCEDTQSAELQNLKVAHFLRKPFTTSSLASTLRACLGAGAET